MELNEKYYALIEDTCRELYIRSLKKIPPDVITALQEALERETAENARNILKLYLHSVELGQTKDMMVCQDTGIPIYWVEIGGNLRVDGSKISDAIRRGTEPATTE